MVDSPLESGPVVGTELKENIAQGYQKLGNVVQEPVKPGVTGEMVEKVAMDRAQAITALASGLERGFSPLIDHMIQSGKEQQAGADYAAGAKAGLAGSDAPGADSLSAGTPAQSAESSQVTRGPSGGLSVLPSFTGLLGGDPAGTVTKAYASGHAASEQVTVAAAATDIRNKYEGDPQGFKQAWGAFVQGRNYDALGQQFGTVAKINAIKLGDEHYRDLLTKETSARLIAEGQAVQTQITGVSADMSALARNGKLDSPEYAQKQDQLQDLYGQWKDNPSTAPASLNPGEKLNAKLHADQGDQIVGQVDSAYQNGGASAAQKSVGDAIDKIPGLSDTEREEFLRQGENRVRYNQGINRDQIEVNKAQFENIKKKAVTDPAGAAVALEGVIASSKATGDHVTNVQATDLQTSMKAMPAGLSPSEVRGYRDNSGSGTGGSVGTPQSGASISSPANLPQSFYDRVHAIENPNNVRGANSAGATGKYQFIPSTWAQYGGGGDVHSDAAQEGAMHRLTADNFQTMRNRIGRDPTQAELYLAHQQGAAGAASLIQHPGERAGDIVGNAAIRQNGGNPNAPASSFVSHWAQKFDGTTPQSGGGGTSKSTPFTDEQIRANPGLYTSYTDLVAGDMTVRTKAAKDLGETIEVATSNHELPPPETTARYFQMAQDIPEEQGRLAKVAGAVQTLSGGQGGGGPMPGGGGSYQQQVDGLVASKDDLFKMGVRAAADKSLDAEASFAKSHPIEYSARKGWSQQPPPINFSDPNSIAQGFQANAQITAGVARREPGVSLSAIPENQKPQVQAWMANGPPQSAQAILDSIAALPGPSRDATIADNKDAIIGMAKSGDPTKMEAAHSLMNQVWRDNPIAFEGKMGKEALSDLRAWQDVRQFKSPEQLAKEAMTADDPNVIRAKDGLKEQANDHLKTVTGKTVVDGMAGTTARWNPFGQDYSPISDAPAQALATVREDYADAYRYQFSQTGEVKAAENYAKEITATKYTFSPTNDGRLTPWAPETSQAYPPVNGSKDYIGTQLAEFMTAQGHGGARAYLVSDGNTEAEIKSGQAPGYRVVALGNDGQFHALPAEARFYANPQLAQSTAEEFKTSSERPSWQGASTPWSTQ